VCGFEVPTDLCAVFNCPKVCGFDCPPRLTLVAFGIDSVIELTSAIVLMWRLNVELRQGAAFAEATEERASKIAGALLFALAVYVVVSASLSLWHRQGSDFSTVGLVLVAVAIPAMYALSRAKLRVAKELGSRALRADAAEAITCGYLSARRADWTCRTTALSRVVGGWRRVACDRLFSHQRGPRGMGRRRLLR
jgi:Cation efflux family